MQRNRVLLSLRAQMFDMKVVPITLHVGSLLVRSLWNSHARNRNSPAKACDLSLQVGYCKMLSLSSLALSVALFALNLTSLSFSPSDVDCLWLSESSPTCSRHKGQDHSGPDLQPTSGHSPDRPFLLPPALLLLWRPVSLVYLW